MLLGLKSHDCKGSILPQLPFQELNKLHNFLSYFLLLVFLVAFLNSGNTGHVRHKKFLLLQRHSQTLHLKLLYATSRISTILCHLKFAFSLQKHTFSSYEEAGLACLFETCMHAVAAWTMLGSVEPGEKNIQLIKLAWPYTVSTSMN